MRHLGAPLVVSLLITTLLSVADGQLSIAANSSFTGIVSGGFLQVNVSFGSWGGNFNNTFQFSTGSVFLDTDNTSRYWQATSDINITYAPVSSNTIDYNQFFTYEQGTQYGQAAVLPTQNAYEAPCTTGCDPSCPDRPILAQNSTVYKCYIPKTGSQKPFRIQARIYSNSTQVSSIGPLQPWYPGVTIPTVTNGTTSGRTIIQGVPNFGLTTRNWALLKQRWCIKYDPVNNATDPGFMVPLTAFGSAANQVGIDSNGLLDCQNTYPDPGDGCPVDPYGACTQVSGGSVYDQYDLFRPYTPLPLMIQDSTWQCVFDSNAYIYIPPSYNNFFSNYRCSFSGGSMWVNLTASVSSLSIVPVYSQISVLSSGALPFAAGTLATGLYAFVQNTGNGTGRFTLVPTGCSGAGNPVVTAGSITQTLLPGATVQFIFPVGVSAVGGAATCTFQATGFGIGPPLAVSVPFASTFQTQSPPSSSQALPLPSTVSFVPYLNCTLSFPPSAAFSDNFYERLQVVMQNSAARILNGTITPTVTVQRTPNGKRRLLQSGPVLYTQVLFPASNSLAVPSQYRLVISQNASAAFQSDPVFYQQFGPVTVATSAASEGFNVVLPPPSQAPRQRRTGLIVAVSVLALVLGLGTAIAAWLLRRRLRTLMAGVGRKASMAFGGGKARKGQGAPGSPGRGQDITNRLFEEEDALETAAHEQAATLLRQTRMRRNPAYSQNGMDPSTGGYTGLQNHDVDVLRHFEDGMQSWYTNQQGSQGQLNDYAALMAMLQGDEVERQRQEPQHQWQQQQGWQEEQQWQDRQQVQEWPESQQCAGEEPGKFQSGALYN